MKKSIIKQIIIDLVIAAVLVAGVSFTVKPTIVRGDSMNDTLLNGDFLIVSKLAYKKTEPEHGDIVVFESGIEGEEYFVKRVIAVGGDTIEIKNGDTFLNGKKLDEPYVSSETEGDGVWEVPDGECFVMGDNRAESLDSRDKIVDFVNGEDIIGKVVSRPFKGGIK